MSASGGGAIPVSVTTTRRVMGGTAIPVYGYDSAELAIADGHRVMGGSAIPVHILTDADLKENGGAWVLEGQPQAMPIYTAAVGRMVMGGVAIAVYPVNNWTGGSGGAPLFISGEVGLVDRQTFDITFDRNMSATDATAGVTLKSGASSLMLKSGTIQADKKVIRYVTYMPASVGDSLTFEYAATSGNLEAEAGGVALADVSAQALTNNVAYLLYDQFNGADGALPTHTPDVVPVGSSYSTKRGTVSIATNRATTSVTADGVCILDLGAADFEAEYVSDINNSNGTIGFAFRSNADASNRMLVAGKVGTPTVLPLHKYTAIATQTQVSALNGVTLADGDFTTYIYANGTNIRIKGSENLNLALDTTDSAYNTLTYVGVGCRVGTGGTMENLKVHAATTWATVAFVGDSITGVSTYPNWAQYLGWQWRGGRTTIQGNYGVTGKMVNRNEADDMPAQITAVLALSPAPDFVFILMGTNDSTYEAADFGAAYDAQLDRLVGGGYPMSHVYCLGVTPRANPGDNFRDEKNVCIAAACAATGANYCDTDGWYDPTSGVDTSDGLHPNASGHQKIVNEMLAILGL